jgi:polyisoprenoid-binding protein YceI
MPSYDAENAECYVFTFKEGLLSAVAHDLRLELTRFRIEVDVANASVIGTFDTTSLRVDTPMKDGAENPTALSPADKAKIEAQIRDDVLHSAQHPQATFRSHSLALRDDGGYDVSGDFTLHGVTRRLQARTLLVASRQQLELGLHQPDFGITPYRAMLGTLKIQSDVKVLIRL